MFKVFKDELDDGYNDVENLITKKFVTKANYKIDTDNNFINCYLLNDDRIIKTTVKGMAWRTEFGHYYGAEQEETNGSIFASNIKELPNQLKRKCEIREAGGNYLSVLNYYEIVYDNLSGGAVERYESFKNIIDILDSEKYLICSDNSEVRKKYIELKKKGAGLYNSYMTAVR